MFETCVVPCTRSLLSRSVLAIGLGSMKSLSFLDGTGDERLGLRPKPVRTRPRHYALTHAWAQRQQHGYSQTCRSEPSFPCTRGWWWRVECHSQCSSIQLSMGLDGQHSGSSVGLWPRRMKTKKTSCYGATPTINTPNCSSGSTQPPPFYSFYPHVRPSPPS